MRDDTGERLLDLAREQRDLLADLHDTIKDGVHDLITCLESIEKVLIDVRDQQ